MQQAHKLKDIQVSFVSREELEVQEHNPAVKQLPENPSDLFYQQRRHPVLRFLSTKNHVKKTNEILLYHGTDVKSLLDMVENGVRVNKSHGVLGTGFYVSPSATEALRWSRRGGRRVVVVFALQKGDQAQVCCVYRNPRFEKTCAEGCELYTSYDTVMMHKYKGGYFPHFWQYLIKDQALFDTGRIVIKKVYFVVHPKNQTQTGGGAAP